MDELHKTQRISIAVLVIAVILVVGLMIKEKPKIVYEKSATEMLAALPDIENIDAKAAKALSAEADKYVFVDLRSPYDFEVKHIENAINIPVAFLLDDENLKMLTNFNRSNKTIVLYGQTAREAISPWILLQEIGLTNTKVLLGGFECYLSNGDTCKNELARHDFAKIATQGGIKYEEAKVAPVAAPKPKPKKTIPVKTKPKAEAEGGC